MDGTPQFTLSGIVLGAPNPRELAEFYRRLLGWTITADYPDWVKLRAPGGPGLSFQTEKEYVRPTWPAGPGDQQMMVHLDLMVEDLEKAGAHAVEAGAVLADYQPQEDVRVYLDPDGHPFCLFMSPVALLSRALDQTGRIIAHVRPEQAHLATPCRSWDVAELVDHVVAQVGEFAGVSAPDFGAAADALLAAWREPGALDRTRQLPNGREVTAVWSLCQHLVEVVIHGWDIAKATGQSTDLDPVVGKVALEWWQENLPPEFRGDETTGKRFGPEVAVPDGAPLYDRLAAFGGRDPR